MIASEAIADSHRARLAWRPRDVATNRHEKSGLVVFSSHPLPVKRLS